jgi:hypothetical protein
MIVKIVNDNIYWDYLAQDRAQRQTPVNTVMKFQYEYHFLLEVLQVLLVIA